ncbi:M12 family metallopeptidase [Flavobacterium pectinovorum]|uniref:M12 family metallopeptidase n=1 Tax=Flavobacterium pectinovorum TaxID=29533 RepID=UPI00265FE1D4|nr:M12 family metallopeptidase [Flavobacterium pectinovorum]WKL47650.1 M12 family metallopeptidase [Flavobacterium pectinovorum]
MERLKIIIVFLALGLSSCAQQNEVDMCTFDLINSKDDFISKPDAAILQWPLWKPGQTIKIKFLDGDSASQEKVKRIAAQWTLYANLKFEYVTKDEYADIRIGFQIGTPGAWSELGMRSAYGNLDRQTMRLGTLTGDETSSRRTILHEFGHALGLIHENASPIAQINWNLSKVYQYYSEWSKEEVDRFVIKSPEQTNYSTYDPLSIMHYYIDPSLTTDGVGIPEQTKLSRIDMVSINKWYPFPIVSILESGQSINDLPWDKRIKSSNGRYSLEFDPGLLKVIDLDENKAIWEVGNSSYRRKPSCYFESTTGNIIIKGSKLSVLPTSIIWTSNTTRFPGATLHLQDDGNLQLIHNGIVRWSSKTEKI